MAGMLGSGKQARGQIYAMQRGLPNLEEVRVYSPTPEKREGFAKEMSARLGLTVRAVTTPQEAVQGLSVVNLSTNSRSPVLETGWLQPGALVISIAPHQLPETLSSAHGWCWSLVTNCSTARSGVSRSLP